MTDNNDWQEYRQLFLADREEHKQRFDKIDAALEELRTSITRIEATRGFMKTVSTWVIPGIVASAVAYLLRR